MTDQEEKILLRIHHSGHLNLEEMDGPEIKTAQGLDDQGLVAFIDGDIYLSSEGRQYIENKMIAEYPTHERRIAALEAQVAALEAKTEIIGTPFTGYKIGPGNENRAILSPIQNEDIE